MTRETESGSVVVGGGLAGLATAAYLARAGRSVTLLEQAPHVGGRAVTQEISGFSFNLGPHALYVKGCARDVYRELNIAHSGKLPTSTGLYAVRQGVRHKLPAAPLSLLTTGLLGFRGKLEVGRLLASIPKLETGPWDERSVLQWLESEVRDPAARQLLEALVRLTTYANAPELQSAGAALRQVQLALDANVLYLDGGWQSLVDGLRQAVVAAGAEVRTGARAVAVRAGQAVRGVELADGATLTASEVILATSPSQASALVDEGRHPDLSRWAEEAIPVRAACLDVGLSRLPDPAVRFALGIDEPLYLSVHSVSARLAPPGQALIHVAKYLHPEMESNRREIEEQLEGFLDLNQPGWREVVVEKRLMPEMVVSNALSSALQRRPDPAVPGIRNLYVAGDWVGPEGLLSDATLASAHRAAQLILDGALLDRGAA